MNATQNTRNRLPLVLMVVISWTIHSQAVEASGPEDSQPASWRVSKDATVGATPAQVTRAISPVGRLEGEKLAANFEISRGPASIAYKKVAPATVLVRTGESYGTGFLISPDGWIVTNHHVAVAGPIHSDTGVQLTVVHVGRLEGRSMELDDTPIIAPVYKTSEAKDLALLKLSELPAGVTQLPFVQLADEAPMPGVACAAMGHPSAGMLWTVREGVLSSVGTWPRDMIDKVLTRLSVSSSDQQQFQRSLQAVPKRKVWVSTCGMNPGDSGGPLVDAEGKLIGVTYAIPTTDGHQGISLDKFSYHIHVDEVKAFIESRPQFPEPHVPDPWPVGTFSERVDRTRDRIWDTLVFGLNADAPCTGWMADLDQDSSLDFDPRQLSDPAMPPLWDFEFAVRSLPIPRTFYDTDNDGEIDLILNDGDDDGVADLVLQKTDDEWRAAKPALQGMIDPSLFHDKQLETALLQVLTGGAPAADSVPPAPDVAP